MTTPLYPTLEKQIADASAAIRIAQVEPWISFEQGISVKRFDGRVIAYSGIQYVGSPREVFWSNYIEPFLEELAARQLVATTRMALEREVSARLALAECKGLLLAEFQNTYRRMADIDQRLRGAGFPDSVGAASWNRYYQSVEAFVEQHYQAELAMLREPGRLERWYGRNKAAVWLFGLVGTACVGALVKTLLGN